MGRILVIRGGAIGDFILTLPAIRLVRESLPHNEIDVMGYEPIIALAKAGGYAERTRSIEYGPMARFFAKNAELDAEMMSYFAGFDVVISYLYDPDGIFSQNLERAGVKTLLACSHRVHNNGLPAAEQLAEPLGALALFLEKEKAWPTLSLDGDIRKEAALFLGDQDKATLIAVHPGSGSPYKNWDLANWVEFLQRMHTAHPWATFVLVTGEAEEESVARFIKDVVGAGIPHLQANGLLLPVLGAVLAQCSYFIGHDSGITHLAAAVGTPCTVLFGPTMSSVWAPRNPGVNVVEHPSGLLSEISVERLFESVSGQIARLTNS